MNRPQWWKPAPEQCDTSTVSVTCVADGHCHSVNDAELAIGAQQRGGHYAAICGHLVVPAPMVAPDGDPCPECRQQSADPRPRRRWLLR